MTKELLALQLNCTKLHSGNLLSDLQAMQAKEAGLVVVYGYSDDLVIFEGAFNGSVDRFCGGQVFVNKEKFFQGRSRVKGCRTINALYYQEKTETGMKIPWRIKTVIPHSKFTIMNSDNILECVGIVFSLEDV